MTWNFLTMLALFLALGAAALVYALRLAGVEDGEQFHVHQPDAGTDHAWREEPFQTFMWQVQAARYWQPPFRSR